MEMKENTSERSMPTPAWQGAPEEETLERSMREGSFMGQFRALIYRNLTIKKRDKRKTLTELLMPLYWILILAIIRISIGDTVLDPVNTPHGQASLMNSTLYLSDETIHVAPNTKEVISVMEGVLSISRGLGSLLYVHYYDTEEELVKMFSDNKTSTKFAVIFPDDPLANKSYSLRFNPVLAYIPSSQLWSGGQECRDQYHGFGLQVDHCTPNSYYYSGFSALQTIIDMVLINQTSTTAVDIKVPEITVENFPRGRYESNGAMTLRNIVPLYMVFAWAQFIVYMMMLVVEEKEKKLKESMKMMGLRDSVYWLSWFTVYAMYVLLLSLVCIILLPLATVFQKANLFLLFLLFVLYGSSSIMFGFMLTPFFNKAKVAGVVGNLVQISLSLLFYLQVYLEDEVNPGLFWGLGIFSPCAFAFAIDKVIYFDYAANGITYTSLWDGPGLPFAGSLIMISVDILLYLFLAYYLDNVVPSEYGTKRKPWFLFEKSFWIKDHNKFHKLTSEGVPNSGYVSDANPDVEPVSAEMQDRTAVHIQNLEKTFSPRGKKPVKAVDGFSLDIYEGQITAILGHNGAGKTTLFNILTGMTAPSSGSATIFGMDISDINDLTEIRRITGICPQHDVVFLTLTPKEHLRFFARIRGVPESIIEREVEQTLREVFLQEKGDTKAADLSGGQKRKLSIAIALIGDPKMIFLDEPTAGVDAYSRRKLWTLLKNRKQGKVILLTTHFMDEADILADRKAIMSKGKLRCCGTSLFLKNKFGLGYHLTLIVEENSEEGTVKKALQKDIPEVQLARYYGKEMSFILPSDSSPHFPSLFKQLDQRISNGSEGIEGYGVSMTTLEEVFLALNDESEEGEFGSMDNVGQQMIREKSPSASPIHSSTSAQDNGATQGNFIAANKGFAIENVDVQKDSWRTFIALLKARVTNMIREPTAVIFLILFPLAFTIASIALADSQSIKISTDDSPPLALKPEIYKPSLYGALLYNATTHKLDSLVSTLTSADMEVDSYSGNYSDLVEEQNCMGSFDVKSFPMQTRPEDRANVRLRFNDSYMHSIPILVNLLNNAIMSSITKGDPIQVFSHPLPITTDSIEFDVSSFIAPMMIGFAFTVIPAGLTMDLVQDREIKARYMLRLNGVGFHLYFSSYLLMMIAIYMVSYIGLLIIIAAFGVKSLIIGPAFGTLAILYLLYIPAAILFSAVMSYIFDKSETARQFYPSMVTTLGFVTYTVVSLIDMLVKSENTNPAQILHVVLTVVCPPYIPFGLMYYINKVYITCSLTNSCERLTVRDYMTIEIIVLFVVTVISIPFWYLLLRVADTVKLGGSWRTALWMDTKKKTAGLNLLEERGVAGAEGEDEDVKQERKNVCAALMENSFSSPVLIYDLGKLYKKKENGNNNPCKKNKEDESFPALKSVSFEVKASQVFGLLGPNGAGKTTTLSIMTAEETPSWGRVQICGEDIQSSMSAVFETMGYCPQHDALWGNITVAEHIATYAEIRGIRKDQIKSLVDTYVKGLEIDEHRNKKSKDCSGGTKRKLSYILSMLGRPKVVLLDEPSTGMDPKSKRFLWNSILSSFRDERSAILTTHSMEEADALCSSIGILVRGSMRCIGPIQHLKNKYGGGYTLEVKVQKERAPPPVSLVSASAFPHPSSSTNEQQTNNMIEEVQTLVQETFPNAVLDEQFDERLIYKVPQTDVTSLALIFETLEKVKSDGLIDEYALSQTTLEQVFLQFARQQEEDEKEDVKAVNEDNGSCL